MIHMLRARIFLMAFILSSAMATASAKDGSNKSEDQWDIRYVHALLGVLNSDDSWTIEDPDGQKDSGDKGEFIYGGGDAQLGYSNGKFQYGLEGGGMVSFNNDSSYFVRSVNGRGSVTVKVDNEMWILESFLGGYLSYRPWRNIRFYASAGPSIMFGSVVIDDVSSDQSADANNENSDTDDRHSDAVFGVYERVGLDVILDNGFIMGVSVRKVNSELDFDEGGVIEFDDFQYFLTLGKAM